MFRKNEETKCSTDSTGSKGEAVKTEDAKVKPSEKKTVPSGNSESAAASEGLARDKSEDQTIAESENQKIPQSAEPDWKSLYAITLADFDNYKKRAARDREDVYRYAESNG